MSSPNIFRVSGDVIHIISFLFLYARLHKSKTTTGVSSSTIDAYLLVFMTRYVDLFWNMTSQYNSILKIMFLLSSFFCSVKVHFLPRCDKEIVSLIYILIPSLFVAAFRIAWWNNFELMYFEFLWSFSIALETFAILPQLFLIQRKGCIENLTANYVISLAMYKTLYIANWIYRYIYEHHPTIIFVWVCGCVQALLYLDFAYYYIRSRVMKSKCVFVQPEEELKSSV